MNRTRIMQTAAAAATCAIVASAIGIATGAAAPSDNDNGKGSKDLEGAVFPGAPGIGAGIAFKHRGALKERFDEGGPRPIGGPPVHSELVVPTRSGEDFETITQDSGTVKSVSGEQLTITEGTEEATYDTVTLDIPNDANVLRNGERAELGDLKEGDNVHVSQGPDHTFVFATDEDFVEKAMSRLRRNLPRPPRIGGLPPGLPPVPMARREN